MLKLRNHGYSINFSKKIIVKSMVGDTLTLTWYFFDWITGDYGGDGEMSFVLE